VDVAEAGSQPARLTSETSRGVGNDSRASVLPGEAGPARPGSGRATRKLRIVTEGRLGPNGRRRVWIGADLIDGLIELLDEHLAIPKRHGMIRAQVG
jgi:hypothetical protein